MSSSQRIKELRFALQGGHSLTWEQQQFALEIIVAFERLLREVAGEPRETRGLAGATVLMGLFRGIERGEVKTVISPGRKPV